MLSKFQGAIVGTAIGDALGAPMETMWAKDIEEKYPEFNVQNCEYVSNDKRKAGEWTDDTQLMIPTIKSIINYGYIHPNDIAKEYVKIYKTESLRGWGRSTIQSIKRLSEGVPWFAASEKSLGTGNGAAMKAAPLGLVLTQTLDYHCYNSIIDVGKITHKEAGIRACFLQSVLIYLAYNNLSNILQTLFLIEKEYFDDAYFSRRVNVAHEPNTIPDICNTWGITSKAEESWVTVAAIYIKIIEGKFEPIEALFELIQQGGDCDTTGAMLGALIGARFGLSIFPQNLITHLEKNDEIKFLANNLHHKLHDNIKLHSHD